MTRLHPKSMFRLGLAIFGLLSATAARSQTSDIDQAVAAAREAQRDAQAAAAKAEVAAARLEKLLADSRSAKPAVPAVAQARAPYTPPNNDYRNAYKACREADTDVASVDYFRRVAPCERVVIGEVANNVSAASSRRVTGLGTALAVDSKGATASLMLGHSWTTRSTRIDDFGPHRQVEQQRVSRWTADIGVRANVDKNDKSLATIATFGSLDRLTSDVALVAQFGRTLASSEPWDRISSDGTAGDWTKTRSSLVSVEALAARDAITAACRKAAGANCEGKALVRWLFASKRAEDDEPAEFSHPDEIKLYNDVFWGPPRDALPRFGWLVRGELSRPSFDYFPFALARVPDPFKPGEFKFTIDPVTFPTDFAARIVKDYAPLNFSLSARGFLHVSRRRTWNWLASHAAPLRRWAGWTLGTTFVGSVAYVRNDQFEKTAKDVQVCPPAPIGQAFVTDQTCTTLNIASPVRTEGFVVGGEIRQGIDLRVLPPILFAPRLTHAFDSGENGLAAPLYFAIDDKGMFTGGIRLGQTWGGSNRDGSDKPADTRVGVVFGVKVGLDGNTGLD